MSFYIINNKNTVFYNMNNKLYKNIMTNLSESLKTILLEGEDTANNDKALLKEAIEILKGIDAIKFSKYCISQKFNNMEAAEYLYKQYLDKIPVDVLLPHINRTEELMTPIRKLGGFTLLISFGLYLSRHSKNKEL